MLAASLGLHAAAALALVMLQGAPPPEPLEQQVALVWTEQGRGAEDTEDSAGQAPPTPPEASPMAMQAAPPTPAEPVEPVHEPERPAAPAEAPLHPAQVTETELPMPPPPPPPRPARPSAPPAQSPARGADAATPAQAAAPMARGASEATGAVLPARQRPGAANAPPEYPHASRIRNEQGRVSLRVEIDAAGRVSGARVLVSSGYPALDQAAIQAVRQWRFEPAMRDGEPVFSTTSIGITFELEGDRRW